MPPTPLLLKFAATVTCFSKPFQLKLSHDGYFLLIQVIAIFLYQDSTWLRIFGDWN